MSTVETVLGNVEASSLGLTLRDDDGFDTVFVQNPARWPGRQRLLVGRAGERSRPFPRGASGQALAPGPGGARGTTPRARIPIRLRG